MVLFRASPLGVVPKQGTNKFRIVQDFSYPRHNSLVPSLNSNINSDDFPCNFGSFYDIINLLIGLPTSAQGATFDVDAAFRTIPIHPDDRRHTVLVWRGNAYVDGNLAFGESSSGGIFGRLADTAVAILNKRGIGPTTNWVDDFLFLRVPTSDNPTTFSYNEQTVYDFGTEHGLPWKESKTRPFSADFRYIGFDWNIPSRIVSLPAEKSTKYSKKLTEYLDKGQADLKATQSIHGTLVHCALISIEGRSRLPSISHFTSSFHYLRNKHVVRPIPDPVAADLRWWIAHFNQSPISLSFANRPPPQDIDFWVDASTRVGIGVVINGHWDGWALQAGWKTNGRDIGWAEMAAVELGVCALIPRVPPGSHVTLKSDNQGVIGALRTHRSRNRQQNLVLQRIVSTLLQHNISISSVYVQSKENIADPPSRGMAPPNRIRSFLVPTPPIELCPFIRRFS